MADPVEERAATPERVWLQRGAGSYERDGWTWCWHAIEDDDVEYVRADRVEALVDALREASKALESLRASSCYRVRAGLQPCAIAHPHEPCIACTGFKAADEIDALRTEVARLRALEARVTSYFVHRLGFAPHEQPAVPAETPGEVAS